MSCREITLISAIYVVNKDLMQEEESRVCFLPISSPTEIVKEDKALT